MYRILFLILSTLSESLTECPSNWITGKNSETCYMPLNLNIVLTWGRARSYCNEKGAELPCMVDIDELYYIGVFEDLSYDMTKIWLGASDRQQEGVWKCIDGKVIDPEHFSWTYDRKIPNFLNYRDCLQLSVDGLYDARCGSKTYFTCSLKDRGRNERTIRPDTTQTFKPTMSNQTTTKANRNIHNNNTTPTPQISTQYSRQANKTQKCTNTHVIIVVVILVVVIVLSIVLNLILFIQYIGQRRKSANNTALYDRPLPQQRQEHLYNSYRTSSKSESDGFYDQPNEPMKYMNAVTRTNLHRHVEKQNGDSAYIDVRIQDNDYI